MYCVVGVHVLTLDRCSESKPSRPTLLNYGTDSQQLWCNMEASSSCKSASGAAIC